MTTTPPPMPAPEGRFKDDYAGWVDTDQFTEDQMQARDAQWMERITYVEKVADDAIELGNQQALRITALEAELAQCVQQRSAAFRTIEQLNDELAKDRTDAERYRWLRRITVIHKRQGECTKLGRLSTLDHAVDAARAALENKP